MFEFLLEWGVDLLGLDSESCDLTESCGTSSFCHFVDATSLGNTCSHVDFVSDFFTDWDTLTGEGCLLDSERV